MKTILLIHQKDIQHYRIPIYNYLSQYLLKKGYYLQIVSEGMQEGISCQKYFPWIKTPLRIKEIIKCICKKKPVTIILFVNLKNYYLFPLLLYLKLVGIKTVIWTHGANLQRESSKINMIFHHIEHALCDSLLLYAEHCKNNIARIHRKKIYIANNTLNLLQYDNRTTDKNSVRKKYGIEAEKNIIMTGRIQKRKRIDDLFMAFNCLNDLNVGLLLVGPDDEGLSKKMNYNKNVLFLGPHYAEEAIDLLRICDVCCIPGAIGLSIVDAQYCGLPVVTENVNHGPEIMYLKEGRNGFIVPKGDINALASRLRILLTDDDLRKRFSDAAKEENATNAHIDRFCEGFLNCLQHF